MEHQDQQNPLYGVEVKLDSKRGIRNKSATRHEECLNLSEVLDFIDVHDGEVRIFDRVKRKMVFDGNTGELRLQLSAKRHVPERMIGGVPASEIPGMPRLAGVENA